MASAVRPRVEYYDTTDDELEDDYYEEQDEAEGGRDPGGAGEEQGASATEEEADRATDQEEEADRATDQEGALHRWVTDFRHLPPVLSPPPPAAETDTSIYPPTGDQSPLAPSREERTEDRTAERRAESLQETDAAAESIYPSPDTRAVVAPIPVGRKRRTREEEEKEEEEESAAAAAAAAVPVAPPPRHNRTRAAGASAAWHRTLAAASRINDTELKQLIAEVAPLARLRGPSAWRAGQIVEPPVTALLRQLVRRLLTRDASCSQLWLIASGAVPASLGIEPPRRQRDNMVEPAALRTSLISARAGARRAAGRDRGDGDDAVDILRDEKWIKWAETHHNLELKYPETMPDVMADGEMAVWKGAAETWEGRATLLSEAGILEVAHLVFGATFRSRFYSTRQSRGCSYVNLLALSLLSTHGLRGLAAHVLGRDFIRKLEAPKQQFDLQEYEEALFRGVVYGLSGLLPIQLGGSESRDHAPKEESNRAAPARMLDDHASDTLLAWISAWPRQLYRFVGRRGGSTMDTVTYNAPDPNSDNWELPRYLLDWDWSSSRDSGRHAYTVVDIAAEAILKRQPDALLPSRVVSRTMAAFFTFVMRREWSHGRHGVRVEVVNILDMGLLNQQEMQHIFGGRSGIESAQTLPDGINGENRALDSVHLAFAKLVERVPRDLPYSGRLRDMFKWPQFPQGDDMLQAPSAGGADTSKGAGLFGRLAGGLLGRARPQQQQQQQEPSLSTSSANRHERQYIYQIGTAFPGENMHVPRHCRVPEATGEDGEGRTRERWWRCESRIAAPSFSDDRRAAAIFATVQQWFKTAWLPREEWAILHSTEEWEVPSVERALWPRIDVCLPPTQMDIAPAVPYSVYRAALRQGQTSASSSSSSREYEARPQHGGVLPSRWYWNRDQLHPQQHTRHSQYGGAPRPAKNPANHRSGDAYRSASGLSNMERSSSSTEAQRVEDLKLQVGKLRDELDSVRKNAAAASKNWTETIKTLESERDAAHGRIEEERANFSDVVRRLQKSLRRMATESSSSRQSETKSRIAELESTVDSLEHQKRTLESEAESRIAELKRTVDTLGSQKQALERAKSRIAELESTVDTLKNQKKSLESDAKSRIAELESMVDTLGSDRQTLENEAKSRIAELESTTDSLESHKQALEEAESRIAELKRTVDTLESQKRALEEEADAAKRRHEAAIEQMTARHKTSRRRIDELQEQASALARDRDALERRAASAEARVDELRRRQGDEAAQHGRREEQIAAELERALKGREELQDELESRRGRIAELEAELADIRAQQSNLQSQLREALEVHARQQDEIEALDEERRDQGQQLTDAIARRSEYRDELMKSRREAAELAEEVEFLEGLFKDVAGRMYTLEYEKEDLEAERAEQIEAHRIEVDRLESQLRRHAEQIADLERQLAHANASHADAEARTASSLDEAQREAAELRAQIREHVQLIDELRAQVSAESARAADAKERLAAAEARHADAAQALSAKSDDMSRQSDALRGQVQVLEGRLRDAERARHEAGRQLQDATEAAADASRRLLTSLGAHAAELRSALERSARLLAVGPSDRARTLADSVAALEAKLHTEREAVVAAAAAARDTDSGIVAIVQLQGRVSKLADALHELSAAAAAAQEDLLAAQRASSWNDDRRARALDALASQTVSRIASGIGDPDGLRRALGAITDAPDRALESLIEDARSGLGPHLAAADADYGAIAAAIARAGAADGDRNDFWASPALVAQSCMFARRATRSVLDAYTDALSRRTGDDSSDRLRRFAAAAVPRIIHLAGLWHRSRDSPVDALRRVVSHDLGPRASAGGAAGDGVAAMDVIVATDEETGAGWERQTALSYAPLALAAPVTSSDAADGPLYRWVLLLAEAAPGDETAAVFARLPAIVYGSDPAAVGLREALVGSDDGRAIALFVYNTAAAVRLCSSDSQEAGAAEREFREALLAGPPPPPAARRRRRQRRRTEKNEG